MNKTILKPLLLLATATVILWFTQGTDTQTLADFEKKLTIANQNAERDVSVFYKRHAEQLAKLAQAKNTKDALKSFDQAIDQLDPDFPADFDGLLRFYKEKMLPWITDIGRVESAIGKDFEEEEVSKRMSIGIRSMFVNDHIAGKLQNRYLTHNPNPIGQQHYFSGDSDLLAESDPGILVYDHIHQKYHPQFFEHLRANKLYDIFIIVPEKRKAPAKKLKGWNENIGKEDARLIYSVLKEIDFSRTILSGAMSATVLGDVYQMAENQAKGKVFLTDIKPFLPSGNRPAQFMATAIYDEDEYIGVLAQQINTTHLNEILSLNENSEGVDNLVVNESYQIISGAEDVKWYETVHIRNKQSVVNLKESGLLQVDNYNKLPVISAFRPIKISSKNFQADFQWRLISEIPLSEIEKAAGDFWRKNIQRFGMTLGLAGLLWLLIVWVTSGKFLSQFNALTQKVVELNFSGILQSLKGRLTVFFFLPALGCLALLLYQMNFNLNKEKEIINTQAKPILFQALETNRLNAESLRLNTTANLHGIQSKEQHDRIKEYLESLVDDEYKLIYQLLKYTDITEDEMDQLDQPLTEMRIQRERVISFNRNIADDLKDWHLLVTEVTRETGRLAEFNPELIEHFLDIDQLVAQTLVVAQEVFFGQKTLAEIEASNVRFNELIHADIDDLEQEEINILELKRIINKVINHNENIVIQFNNAQPLRDNLASGYENYFSSYRSFFDRFNYELNPIALLEKDVSDAVKKTLHQYGIRKVFGEEEEEEEEEVKDFSDRVGGLVKGKASFLMELYKEMNIMQTRMKDISKLEDRLTKAFYSNVDTNLESLEKILKKKKKKKIQLDMMDYLFIYQANLLEDARHLGDYIAEVNPLNLNEVFMDSSIRQQMELLGHLRTTGFAGVDELNHEYLKRKKLISEIIRIHHLYIDISIKYEESFNLFLDALRSYRSQNYANITSINLGEILTGFERFRTLQMLFLGLLSIFGVFLVYITRKGIEEMLTYTESIILASEGKADIIRDVGNMPKEFIPVQVATLKIWDSVEATRKSLVRMTQLAKERLLSFQIVDSVSSAIVVVNKEGRILQTNRPFMQMFRLKKNDVEEQLLDLIKNGLLDLSAIKDSLAKVRQTGNPVTNVVGEIEDAQLGKKILNISVFGKEEEDEEEGGGEVRELFSKVVLKRSKDRLQVLWNENPEIFYSTLDSGDHGVIIADNQGNVVYSNRAMVFIFGLTKKEMENQPIHIFLPENLRKKHESQSSGFMKEDKSRAMGQERVLKAARADGSEFEVEVGLIPLEIDGEKRVVAIILDKTRGASWETSRNTRFGKLFEEEEEEVYFITIDDITEQVALRKQAEEIQKSEADMAYQSGLAEMGTNVLHNIGNTLGSVSVATEMLMKEVESLSNIANILAQGEGVDDVKKLQHALSEAAKAIRNMEQTGFKKRADKITEGVNYISDMIHIQQNMASQDVKHATTFNLATMLQNSVMFQADSLKEVGIEIKLDLSKDIVDVVLPMNPLMQLVSNLIKNSKESIQERSQSEKVAGEIRITINTGRHDDFTLTVADNGCGIAPRKLNEIFSHGYSTKDRGTGYGLHSAATFVQSIGGTIKADSDGKNKGAVFTILLPMDVS